MQLRPQSLRLLMHGVDTAGSIPSGPANLGTNLSDDHPISLTPATGAQADPEIVINLPADAKVKYDANGQVQCTSCHYPHDDSNSKFLVAPDVAAGYGSQLCLACHAKFNWGISAHRNANHQHAATTIKAQACAACHQVHAAPIPEHLLRGGEEGLCNSCHDGSTGVSPALKNVAGTFALPYAHPTATVFGKHRGAETFTYTNDQAKRHAECADCHNPHSVQAGTHTQGSSKIGAVLLGAWGMKPIYSSTPWTNPVGWQKEVFTDTIGPDMLEAYLYFKCHKNLAKAFNPNNPSYHAVVGDSQADPASRRRPVELCCLPRRRRARLLNWPATMDNRITGKIQRPQEG